MVDANLQQLIEQGVNLPSPPAIAARLLNTVQSEETSFNELSRIIATDPALTAKMLRVANSGLYALPTEITSINRALSVLGTNATKNIALSFVIAASLRNGNSSAFNVDDYWRRSVTAAVAAELLSRELGQQNDDIFVTALLHNIGMLIIYLHKKNNSDGTADVEKKRRDPGYDHQQVGSVLVAKWGLPERIAAPIACHHNPETAPDDYKATAYLLHFADRLSAVYNEKGYAEQARLLQTELERHYRLDRETVKALLDRIAERSIGILKTFEIDPGQMKPYSQMLQEANEELGRLNLSYEQLVIELKEAKEKSERLAKELSDANLRLQGLVYTDGLTGLFNHRYFQDTLRTELARSQRYHSYLSLILFDIDLFKNVNDTYGHMAGDQVLINLSQAIKKTIRPSDVLARYGGEEFAVILPETDITGVKVFAARLRRTIENLTTETEGQRIKVTISAGGTTFCPEQPEVSKDMLIKTADRGLYLSKENGRNQITILATENAP